MNRNHVLYLSEQEPEYYVEAPGVAKRAPVRCRPAHIRRTRPIGQNNVHRQRGRRVPPRSGVRSFITISSISEE